MRGMISNWALQQSFDSHENKKRLDHKTLHTWRAAFIGVGAIKGFDGVEKGLLGSIRFLGCSG